MNKSDISKYISDILKFVFLVYKLFIFALAPRKQPPDPEVYIVGFAGELILLSAVLSNYCTLGQGQSFYPLRTLPYIIHEQLLQPIPKPISLEIYA